MTTSIRLTAYDKEGRTVLARRRPGKVIGGGLWDSLAAGLVKASEEPEHALYRELFEEAGLSADDLTVVESARFVQEMPVPEGYLREVVRNYEGRLKEGVRFENRDGEVAEFKAFDPFEALRMAEQEKLEESKSDIGWGHQIRSYVLDQSRVKDLRTNVETGNTGAVLDGDLDQFIEASLKMGI